MAASGPKIVIASLIGFTFSAFFVGGNLTFNYQGVPALLLPSPPTSPKIRSVGRPPTSATPSKPATSNPHLARQWQKAYNIGKVAGPIAAAISAAAYVVTFRQLPASFVTQRRLHLTAAALVLGVIPWTLIVRAPTNKELSRRADLATQGIEEAEEDLQKRVPGVQRYTTPDLVGRWVKLNLMRSMFPFAAMLAVATALVW